MKRLSYIIILLMIVAGVFQWLSRSYGISWEPKLRSHLQKSASRVLQKRVQIDTIALAFKSVRLINVRVTDPEKDGPPLFEVSQIELSFSLLGLPRAILNKEPVYAIGGVHLSQPRVRLSAQDIPQKKPGGKPATLPPWFTLSWDGGTFQWEDARAPHGQWTLYQTAGAFRVRGPQRSVTVNGKLEQAERVRVDGSWLGKRWKTTASVDGGNTQELSNMLASFSQKNVLPPEWTVPGTFRFSGQAGGKSLPKSSSDWIDSVQKASLHFDAPAEGLQSSTKTVLLNGTWSYKDRQITTSRFSVSSPWATTQGSVEIVFTHPGQDAAVNVHADLKEGTLGKVPFEQALVNARLAGGTWEFKDTVFHVMNGKITVNGTTRATGHDLSITAENLTLGALQKKGQSHFLEGQLKASCVLRGTREDYQLTGAWWLAGGAWAKTPLGESKGDLEVTPKRFHLQGKSDTTHFRVSLAGRRTPEAVILEDVAVTLPSDAAANIEGRYAMTTRSLAFTWNVTQLNLASDLPFLPRARNPIAGSASARGELGGTLQEPRISATVTSPNVNLYNKSMGDASAVLRFEKGALAFPSFKLGGGVSGSYAAGEGTVRLEQAKWGNLRVERGYVRFQTRPESFEISELVLHNKKIQLSGKAKASWPPSQASGPRVTTWTGTGKLTVSGSTTPVQVPLEFEGKFLGDDVKRDSHLTFAAQMLGGVLKGEYKAAGTRETPEDLVTARLMKAKWRAFPFSASMNAAWSKEGLKPLRIEGEMVSGGSFELSGQISPDAMVNGTFYLRALNLKALGESLRFPKKIEGVADATLTVTGPLDNAKWNGSFTAGNIIYAAGSDRPFKLDRVALNLTLAALDQNSEVMRLTITEGEAKTAEELIRFHKGSFIEFSGDAPARLVLGTDLRNLHLGAFTLFGGLGMEGTWQIKPEGFAIQTKAQTRSLFINNYELEEGVLQADYYDGTLTFSAPPNVPPLITGTIRLKNAPQLSITDLFISGKYEQGLAITGELGPTLWDFKMEGRGLDIATLSELAGFPYPMSGAANLRITGKGDAKHPHVEGSIELDRGRVLGLSYKTGSAIFVWQDDRISFTKLLLHEPGQYGIEGSGVFPLRQKPKAGEAPTPSPPIDFSMRLIDANLSLLKSISSEVTEAHGPLEGLLQIKGTLEDPELKGTLKLTGGDVTGAHYFRRLRGGAFTIEFDDNTIYIRDVRGKSGDGEFRGSGKIVLAGFTPASYDLKLSVVSSKGVEIQVPELAIPDSPLAKRFKFLTTESRGDVRGQVSLRGPAEAPTFSGDAIVSNGHFTFPPSRKKTGYSAVLAWFGRIYWDVNLKVQDGAWFENELVQANVNGQLAIKGPSNAIEVDGGLDIPEGRISYLGLQFDIQQARFDIRPEKSGDKVVNVPYMRGVAESEIQAVDTVSGSLGGSRTSVTDTITLTIDYAPISQIKPRLTSASNPTMAQDKLLARVTKTDTENLTPQERNYMYQKQLVTLIDTSLTTPLAQNVLKKAGIADRLRAQHVIDPNAVSGGDLNASAAQQQNSSVNLLANTKYTVEKDLSNRLSMGYGVRFIQSGQVNPEIQEKKLDLVSDIQLSYRWFKNVFVRGSFDLPTASPGILPDRRVTIEPRWRFGWWGNTNPEKQKK